MSNLMSTIAGSQLNPNMMDVLKKQQADEIRKEQLAGYSPRQQAFNQGTMNLLDEARNVAENAVQQGQELNPQIYQMLGLDPQYTDNTDALNQSSSELDAAQKQYESAQQTMEQIKGIPQGKRTPAQRKQLNQLKRQMPNLQKSLQTATDAHGKLSTMPKEITGFNRMDPSQIPANSPFSQQNPLAQIQQTEAQRAEQAMQGGIAVDSMLVHQWTQGEGQLRAQLAQRLGPDYENTSVGQMALQQFEQQKNMAFANWNYTKQQEYANQAFSQAGAQQQLTGGLIGLMREPSSAAAGYGSNLSNLAQQRDVQQQTTNQYLLGRSGLQMGPIGNPNIPPISGGSQLAQLLEQMRKGGTTSTGSSESGMEGGAIGNSNQFPTAQETGGLSSLANSATATEAAGVDSAVM